MKLYLASGVSPQKVKRFYEQQREVGTDVHAFSLYKGGKLQVSCAFPPYSTSYSRQVYSLSKTFASTAVGLAWDRGLIDVEERILTYFPEYADLETVRTDERWQRVTVKHLLTMNSGNGGCTMAANVLAGDVSGFFKRPLQFEPGSHFAYDTGASLVLSALVARVTGMRTFDFLRETLWEPLGVVPQEWKEQVPGISDGGIGLIISCDDIARFGLMYLQKGIYEGKRVLSEAWIGQAKRPWSDTSNHSGDWACGYGYQLWLNTDGSYRADGAFGQFCIINEEQNAVMTLMVESPDAGAELTLAHGYLRDYLAEETEDIAASLDELWDFGESFYAVDGQVEPVGAIRRADYRLEQNAPGWQTLTVERVGRQVRLLLGDGKRFQKLTANAGTYTENRIVAANFKPCLLSFFRKDVDEICHLALTVESADEEQITLFYRYLDCPHSGRMRITLGEEFRMEYTSRMGGIQEGSALIIGKRIESV